jgi:hypothetical protein
MRGHKIDVEASAYDASRVVDSIALVSAYPFVGVDVCGEDVRTIRMASRKSASN